MAETERKCLANDSLAGFSDLSTSEENQSHYHIKLLLQEIRESRRDLAPNKRQNQVLVYYPHLLKMAGSATLKNMFANVFVKIQTTKHANNSTGFEECRGAP